MLNNENMIPSYRQANNKVSNHQSYQRGGVRAKAVKSNQPRAVLSDITNGAKTSRGLSKPTRGNIRQRATKANVSSYLFIFYSI